MKYPECSSKIGRFDLTATIGLGGQGRIYKAYDPILNRSVALKVLNPSLYQDTFAKKRFDEEINHLVSLNIPGIVKVFDKGQDNQWLYYTMELIEGTTIDSFFEDHELTTVSKMEYLAKLARIIKLLHKQGICHRDIKPSNVMIDCNDEVKLLDFGIAKNTTIADLQLTQQGQTPGSPGYMSPEQIIDKVPSDKLSESDIYAFGVLIYEVLTGQLPYDIEFLHPDEIYSVMSEAHIKSIRSFDKNIPEAVNSLVMRMLSVKPIDRPAVSEVEEFFKLQSIPRQQNCWFKYIAIIIAVAIGVFIAESFVTQEQPHDPPAKEYYTIKQGDTLYGIANAEKVSFKELIKLNNLHKNSVLQIGQILRLPLVSPDHEHLEIDVKNINPPVQK